MSCWPAQITDASAGSGMTVTVQLSSVSLYLFFSALASAEPTVPMWV